MTTPAENERDDAPDALTPEQQRRDAWLAAHPFGDQDENGVDLSLLRENLALSPTERYRKHQRALRLVRSVRRAGNR